MKTAELLLYGEIADDSWAGAGEWGFVGLNAVRKALDEGKDAKKIIVRINSVGGEVSTGWAIFDALLASGKEIVTINEGQASSMASVLSLAAKKSNRQMNQHSTIMVHNPWTFAAGDSKQLRKYADELEEIQAEMALFYSEATEVTLEEAVEMMDKETTLRSTKALELGFVGEVIEVDDAYKEKAAKVNAKATKYKEEHATKAKSAEEEITNAVNQIKSRTKIIVKMSKPTILDRIKAVKSIFSSDEPKAKEYTLEGGEVITTDSDEDLATGQKVTLDGADTPDETYTLEDGTKISTDSESVISEVVAPEEEEGAEAEASDIEALTEVVENLAKDFKKFKDNAKAGNELKEALAKVEEMETNLEEMTEAMEAMAKGEKSNFTPKSRKGPESKEDDEDDDGKTPAQKALAKKKAAKEAAKAKKDDK